MFTSSMCDVINTSSLDVYDVDINTSNLDVYDVVIWRNKTSNLDIYDVDIRRHKHEQLWCLWRRHEHE
jgi:hypothetical protein